MTEIKKQQKLHPAINAYKIKSIQNPFDAIVLKYKGTSVLKPLISFIYEAESDYIYYLKLALINPFL